MNVLAIIAALASGLLADPPATASVVDGRPVTLPPGADRAELEAAVSWFLSAVAEPVLQAREPGELRRLLADRSNVAVEARGAIASAVSAWLKADSRGSALELNDDLRGTLAGRNPDLLHLLEVTFSDARDLFEVIARRRPTALEMSDAMSTLTPVATDADVMLILAIVAAVRGDVAPDIERAVNELALANVLRHRAQLHAMLRRWDPTWKPTVDAPEWADDPMPVDLLPDEVEVIARLFRDPPEPNAALRRVLARR